MGSYVASDLPYILETPSGSDELLVHRFAGSEGISALFNFRFDLLSENPAVPFEDLIGKAVTLKLRMPDGGFRHLNGRVSRFGQAGRDETFTRYELDMVPWTWYLGKKADCKIFQEISVPQIVMKIFDEAGYSGLYEDRLTADYPARTYCVQYRETSLAFVSRLLEEEGIFYFFEHHADKHVLVLGDGKSAFRACEGQEEVRYDPVVGGAKTGDVLTGYQFDQEVCSGKHTLSDYDFKNPATSLLVSRDHSSKIGEAAYEIYDYPGRYRRRDPGESRNGIRLEENMLPRFTGTGESMCRAFHAGALVRMRGNYRADRNEEVILLSVHHYGDQGLEISGPGGAETETSYGNRFVCTPSKYSYRPPRVTPKPFVKGPQTAVVVGKNGEEIWVDKWGRIKVQFHWDREGKRNENSSCWVRVSQGWAGANWGVMFIPRIGQEVIVDFLEGDPDQPIVTGRVYNSAQMPPYTLPGEQTKSTIQSRSTKGGSAENYNEIRFEDKKGEEELYLQAEKDWNTLVKNDKSSLIKHDKSEKVENDKSIEVRGKHGELVHKTFDQTIKDDRSIVVEKNQSMAVTLNRTAKVDKSDSLTVAENRVKKVGKDLTEAVSGARSAEVGRSDKLSVGEDRTATIGKSDKESVGKDKTTEVGNTMKLTVAGERKAEVGASDSVTATEITLTATTKITLVCGGATITLTPAGIALNAPIIKLN